MPKPPKETDHYCTPRWVWEPLASAFQHILLDPCWNENSTVEAVTCYDGKSTGDGLEEPWVAGSCRDGLVFVNPPYSDPDPWVRKCHETGIRGQSVVALLKMDSAVERWRRYCRTATICLLDKRVAFELGGKAVPAPWSSVLVYWGNRPGIFIEAAAPYGDTRLGNDDT